MSEWIGGARSTQTIPGDGWYSFQLDPAVSGAVLGLNTRDFSADPAEINFGIYASLGTYKAISNGVPTGNWGFSERTWFHVMRYDGKTYLLRGDTSVPHVDLPFDPPGEVFHVFDSTPPGTVFLDASLLTYGDVVYDLTVNVPPAPVTADVDISLQPLRAYAFASTASASVEIALEPLRVRSDLGNSVNIALEALAATANTFASFGSIDISVEPLSVLATPGEVDAMGTNHVEIVLQPLYAQAFAGVQNTGSVDIGLGALVVTAVAPENYALVDTETLPLYVFASGREMQSDGVIYAKVPAITYRPTIHELSFSETIYAAITPTVEWPFLSASDTLHVGSSATLNTAFATVEQVVFSDTAVAQQLFQEYISEGLNLRSALANFIPLLTSETLTLSGEQQEWVNRILLARDVLSLLSPSSTQAELNILVAEAVALQTTLEAALLFMSSDTLELSTAVEELRAALLVTLEQIQLTATSAPSLSFVVLSSDSLEMTDDAAGFLNFILTHRDEVSFVGSLTAPDGTDYQTWVVNLNTKAPFEYTNYPFNSFALCGQRPLALKEDGLYELVGDDDAGEMIEAHIKTGLVDFGTQHLKNVCRAYLGYKADGALFLHVTDTDGGEKREVIYELDRTFGAPKEARIKLGKGVRARYWQFELKNVDGSDFTLDALDVLPVVLKRRV